MSARVRFDRNELSGAFGDIGTDFPLVAAMILSAGLPTSSVLTVFGAMQVLTGFLYGFPMPVQPLKAMAVIVIAQKLPANILYGGGLAIGITMLLLTLTGAVDWLARVVPKCVVRGIQFGLGIQLALLALKEYVPQGGAGGYLLAAAAFALTLSLLGNRRFPPAPFVIGLGILYGLAFNLTPGALDGAFGLALPSFRIPSLADVTTGFLVLALPQIPLSLGNSILATEQNIKDFFPSRQVTARRISLTYSVMNLINPFFGGVPTCHGSGGLAGHYAFGGRTGGSVVIYGLFYLALGLFFSAGFGSIIQLFPKPVLGMILAFEALTLMGLVRDLLGRRGELSIALIVALCIAGLGYGYLVGLVVGLILWYSPLKNALSDPPAASH